MMNGTLFFRHANPVSVEYPVSKIHCSKQLEGYPVRNNKEVILELQ